MSPDLENIALDVVVRCRNEQPFTERTLRALMRQQHVSLRLHFFDCGSTDGSREAAVPYASSIFDIPAESYRPGAVLNLGMSSSQSEIVAFVNADAVPVSDTSLRTLIEPLLRDPTLGAVYARQVAREHASPHTRVEMNRAFSSTLPMRVRNGAFFSMAASAIRRSAWNGVPFDPFLRYSEDVDWCTRIAALGWQVTYVPTAQFEHSHDYDLEAQFRRRAGEGKADTQIHRLASPSFVRECVRPFVGALQRDWRSGVTSISSLQQRAAQAIGYFAGVLVSLRAEHTLCSSPRTAMNLNPNSANSPSPETLCKVSHHHVVVREHLAALTRAVRNVLGAKLETLFLVGSFARGEGVLVRRGNTWAPLNDYDLVAVVPDGERSVRADVQMELERQSLALGIHAEVWTLSRNTLKQPPNTLFWLDVAQGAGVVLIGSSETLRHLKTRTVRDIPMEEVSRLLTNRCVGLALSALEPDDTEAMIRHAHKAALACGDAALISAALYPFDLDARLQQIVKLSPAPSVGESLAIAYQNALRWKRGAVAVHSHAEVLRWFRTQRESLERWHLHWEHERTGAPKDPLMFAVWNQQHLTELRDVHPMARMAHRAAGMLHFTPWMHARERLTRAAALLAYASESSLARSSAAKLLGLPATHTGAAALARALRSLAARGG